MNLIQRATIAPEKRVIAIDLDRHERLGFISERTADSSMAEAFRLIRRPLLAAFDAPGAASGRPAPRARLIAVTSALPGEGRTFTAVNLACSIAGQRDHEVVLVDGDVLRPNIPQCLGFQPECGLLDLLDGSVPDIGEAVLHTDIPGLSVLPAGRPRPMAAELLAGECMGVLAERLIAGRNDRVVVFDTPPLLASSESLALVQVAGQTVLVVEAEKTGAADVEAALDRIGTQDGVAFVLNKAASASSRRVRSGFGWR